MAKYVTKSLVILAMVFLNHVTKIKITNKKIHMAQWSIK